jgi:hypothetical protein
MAALSDATVKEYAHVANQRSFWTGFGCGLSAFASLALVRLHGPLSEIRHLREGLNMPLTPLERLATNFAFYATTTGVYIALVILLSVSFSRRVGPSPYFAGGLAVLGIILTQLFAYFSVSPLFRITEALR